MKRKTKELSCFVLAVCMAGLCACSPSVDNSAKPGPDAPGSDENPNEIRMLTDVDGFINRNSTGTEAGYYEMERATSDYVNIFYTDYATLSKQPLCADPMCAHNSESCTSYLSGADALVGLFVQNDKLYIYNMPADAYPSLYQCELNGSNRVPFFEFTAEHDAPKDAIAGDGESLYYLCETVVSDASVRVTVQKLDCATKQTTELTELPHESSESYYLVGAYDHSLLLKKNAFGETWTSDLYRYDVDRNELTQVVDGTGNLFCRTSGNLLLYWDTETQDVHCLDLAKNKDTIVYSDPILGPNTTATINGMFDDHLIMLVTKAEPIETVDWDAVSEEVKAAYKAVLEEDLGHPLADEEVYPELVRRSSIIEYGIDFYSNKYLAVGPDETAEITLTMDENGTPFTVLAETKDDFLVNYDYETIEVTFTDPDGTPYTSGVRSMKRALISKENFYHNIADYRVIAQ